MLCGHAPYCEQHCPLGQQRPLDPPQEPPGAATLLQVGAGLGAGGGDGTIGAGLGLLGGGGDGEGDGLTAGLGLSGAGLGVGAAVHCTFAAQSQYCIALLNSVPEGHTV